MFINLPLLLYVGLYEEEERREDLVFQSKYSTFNIEVTGLTGRTNQNKTDKTDKRREDSDVPFAPCPAITTASKEKTPQLLCS